MTFQKFLIDNLLRQHKQFGKLIVAYDFDNTVYPFSCDIEMLIPIHTLIRKAKEKGCECVCFTSSDMGLDKITGFLHYNNIPCDGVNKSSVHNEGKMYYNILLDDKAGLQETIQTLEIVLDLI